VNGLCGSPASGFDVGTLHAVNKWKGKERKQCLVFDRTRTHFTSGDDYLPHSGWPPAVDFSKCQLLNDQPEGLLLSNSIWFRLVSIMFKTKQPIFHFPVIALSENLREIRHHR
jgi:hypothetical protein